MIFSDFLAETWNRAHHLLDAKRLRRTTLHLTDIYRDLSLGAPDELTQLAYYVDLIGFFSLLLSSGTLFSKCCRHTRNFAEYSIYYQVSSFQNQKV